MVREARWIRARTSMESSFYHIPSQFTPLNPSLQVQTKAPSASVQTPAFLQGLGWQ